jgi:tetratricopeptide (TPR) repeat protein
MLSAWSWAPLAAAAPETEAERADLSEQLLQQGREAFEGKRYDEAHQRLSRAYRLLQSYRTACALGQVELELEMHRDAAEHLDICVSRYPADDPQQARDRVLDGLRDTRRHVAVFEPLLNVRGATILINGVEVSTTPLESDLFVEPGLRRVTARKAGYRDVSAELFFPAGGTTQWQAALTPLVSEQPAHAPGGIGNMYLGVGTALTAVTLAGGVVLSVIAHVEEERAMRAVADAGACPSTSTAGRCVSARSQLDAASQSSDLAVATLWAGAGLGLMTAVVAWVTSGDDVDPSEHRSSSSTFALQPSVYRGGAGATWIGRF